jgi:hypothetical protein
VPKLFREQPQAWLRRRWYRLVGGFSVQDYLGRNTVNDWTSGSARNVVLAEGGRSDRASELFFSRFEMPRPKPSGHLFDLVRTKIFPRFELVAQSAPDDGPVDGAILIRGKSPASWLMRDAVVANFKLLDQDQSSNSHCACHAHGFAMRTLVALHLVRRSASICSS